MQTIQNKKTPYLGSRGITLIEILAVLSILGILFAVALPSFGTMRNIQILRSTSLDISSSLSKARSQALSSINSSEYGVHFESNKIVIFKGTVFSSSDPNNEDILITSPAYISSIDLSDSADSVYFDRLSGAPNKSGSVTLSISSLSKSIIIYPTGVISIIDPS